MSDESILGIIWVSEITGLNYSARTGELEVDVLTPTGNEPVKMRIHLSGEATRALALSLARSHKFLDEQIEGKPASDVLQ